MTASGQDRHDPARIDRTMMNDAARSLSGSFAWPTLFLGVGVTAAYWTCVVAAARGSVHPALSVPLLGLLAYVGFTVQHEADHYNISGRNPRLSWVDELLGRVVSVPLYLCFPLYRRTHLLHHAHVNDPSLDPDWCCADDLFGALRSGAMLWLAGFLAWMPAASRWLLLHGVGCGIRMEAPPPEARKTYLRFNLAHWLAIVVLVGLGYGVEVVMLWFLPALVGFEIVVICFAWLPHHPFITGRYDNARIITFPGSKVLLLGQGFHLLHHLFPRVPFYRLPRLFRIVQPALIRAGARHEGFPARAGVLSLSWDYRPVVNRRRASELAYRRGGQLQ